MAKKTSKIITLYPQGPPARSGESSRDESSQSVPARPETPKNPAQPGQYVRSWRLQLSAIFWHTALFVLPLYAVWQGLYVRWQAWHSLILWGVIAAFFLFFISDERLVLSTQAPWRWPLWDALIALGKRFQQSVFVRRTRSRRTSDGVGNTDGKTEDTNSIFGNYTNDGKGDWGVSSGVDDEDDGITIEDYLKKRKGQQTGVAKHAGFDWNWKQHGDEEESVELLQKYRRADGLSWETRIKDDLQTLQRYWRQNWQKAWSQAFPAKEQRQLFQALFWAGALWLPLSFAALALGRADVQEILQRGGFVSRRGISWNSFYSFMVFLVLTVPLLSQLASRKLQRSLGSAESLKTPQVVKLRQIFQLLLELDYTLALLLLLGLTEWRGQGWGAAGTGLIAGLAVLLSLTCGFYRLILLQRLKQTLPLYLFRQLCCLSLSVGLLLYLV